MNNMRPEITVDHSYYFDEHKRLVEGSAPEVAAITEEIDWQYEHNPTEYFQRIIESARPPIAEGGAPYIFMGDSETSEDTAVVVPLPYCNPAIPDVVDAGYVARFAVQKDRKAFDSNTWNNPLKHVYLFDVIKALGVRDEQGKTLPVIAVGADSQDYHPKLDRGQKKALRQGLLAVYRNNAQDILDAEHFGKAHVAGYSQGGSVAHAILAEAISIDVLSGTLAEMPTYKDRSIGALAVNYLLNKPTPKNNSGIKSEEKWTESGPLARRDLEFIQNRAMNTMAQAIARGAWRTAFALRHSTMIADLETALKTRGAFPLTIAWNQTSALTHDIEPALFSPDNQRAQDLWEQFRKDGKLRLVKALGHEAVGAPHLAGESPMYYASMIGQSVAWATAK